MARPTMADVAAAAGVSTPTVSKVFKLRSDVSETTRERVHLAARELGYPIPPGAAFEATRPIALVIDALHNPWALEVIRGAETAAAEAERPLLLSSTHEGSVSPETWVSRAAAANPIGVIAALTHADDDTVAVLRELDVALVILDAAGDRPHDVASVGATNWLGGMHATEHLLTLGHRRIAHVAGPRRFEGARSRLDGFLSAMRRADADVDPALLIEAPFTAAGGREAASRLLALTDRPTAIVASNDLQAAGVYQAAAQHGVRVPDDLSVVGFDGLPLGELLSPPLTTIAQPIGAMAQQAVRILLERGGRGENVELGTNLLVRQSTRALDTTTRADSAI